MGGMPALTALTIWGAFALGLTGGFGHCLAMCGPFVAGASLGVGARTQDARSATGFQAAYHVGRLITYSAIGAILGALGGAGRISTLTGPYSPVAFAGWLKLGVGVATVLLGVWMVASWATGRHKRGPELPGLLSIATVVRLTGRLSRKSAWAGLPFGALMGLLPCGPLLPVELAALTEGSAFAGAALMLAFGLGTVPALAGFGVASGLVGARARNWMVPAAGVIVMSLGGLTLARAAMMMAQ